MCSLNEHWPVITALCFSFCFFVHLNLFFYDLSRFEKKLLKSRRTTKVSVTLFMKEKRKGNRDWDGKWDEVNQKYSPDEVDQRRRQSLILLSDRKILLNLSVRVQLHWSKDRAETNFFKWKFALTQSDLSFLWVNLNVTKLVHRDTTHFFPLNAQRGGSQQVNLFTSLS